MTGDLTIRLARPDDRPAMEHICAHTWEDGDYIPYVWDAWLTDEQGPLLVGELEGRVVALNKVTFQTPEEVWLQGMRVDPDYRRRGIAARFLEHSLAYARDHGARVARLDTSIRNTPVHLMTEKAGMERIGVYVLWTAEALPEGPPATVLSPEALTQVEAFLRASPVLHFCRDVYERNWAWRELSPDQVARLLQDGAIVTLRAPDGPLVALATMTLDAEDEALGIGFVDGHPPAVAELATAIRAHAGRIGAKSARAWLPEVPWLRDAFASAGYAFGEWQAEMLLLERRLGPPEGGPNAL